jgi:lipase ATG15
MDIPADATMKVTGDFGATWEAAPEVLRAKASSTTIQRLADRRQSSIDRLFEHAAIHGEAATLPSSAWTNDEIAGPNVTDKETVLSFARMANNAYTHDFGTGEWQEVGGGFNYTEDFGWEKDGLRGHIFADKTNKTIVVGLKGTSMAIFDGAETTGNDKLNDNLFGSCCCGQGGAYGWKQVCDCMTDTYTCNSTCLVKSLREKSHYYFAARDLYHNVTERYPDSDVWLAGHSLGGVVGSLLGLTYGVPVMTFEAYPDAMAAARLGLPTPPGYRIGGHQSRPSTGIHHFGHTADPIFMGTCNAATSLCTIAGYALQSQCHTGRTCIYDTVGDLGWRPGVGTHRIVNVIKDVLEKYDTVPTCEEDVECQDCFNWKFFESNSSDTTTSKTSKPSSTTSQTRTETCKTPGWWGCQDESTTTTTSHTPTTTMTSTITTSSCKTPGWFGCKDPTTLTLTTTITSPSAAPEPIVTTPTPADTPATSSAQTASSTALSTAISKTNSSASSTANQTASSSSSSAASSSSASCATPGWFGCKDASTSTSGTSSTAVSTPTGLLVKQGL